MKQSEVISKLDVKKNTFKCDVCKLAVEIVDHELTRQESVTAILDTLKNGCNVFPENRFRVEVEFQIFFSKYLRN